MLLRTFIIFFYSGFLISTNAISQCCAGGSGSPIAGGASQGVLLERQFELNTNFQFINTDKFYSKDSPDTTKYFDHFSSTYEYFRIGYGVTKNFTMSIESGYYFKKKEVGKNGNPYSSYESKGIADLIVFPRYDIINRTREKTTTEVTLGLGFKFPIGSYNDSASFDLEVPYPPYVYTYKQIKPQAVQLTSGAEDIIFYAFLLRGYNEKKFKIFANALYIRKGWNPDGEKLGDFASVGLFASKMFLERLGVTLQARYEWVDSMKINEFIYQNGTPSNSNPGSTGYKKVFFTPQLSFTKGKFTIYASTDIPIYQFMNTDGHYSQAGSQYLTTVGLSFRFFAVRPLVKSKEGKSDYYCPMHPEIISAKQGQCPKCGMDLEKKK